MPLEMDTEKEKKDNLGGTPFSSCHELPPQ